MSLFSGSLPNRTSVHSPSFCQTHLSWTLRPYHNVLSATAELLSATHFFVFLFDCNDSLLQPLIADKMFFSFSYHSFNGSLNRPVLLKNPGEKRDIFCKNCFLECNAGSGYHDRTLLIRGTSFCKEGIFSHQNTAHQISIRLADTDPLRHTVLCFFPAGYRAFRGIT